MRLLQLFYRKLQTASAAAKMDCGRNMPPADGQMNGGGMVWSPTDAWHTQLIGNSGAASGAE